MVLDEPHGYFSDDRTRYVEDAPAFGIACYEGEVRDGEFFGRHSGIVQSHEDAMAWLRGENVKIHRVYPEAPEAQGNGDA